MIRISLGILLLWGLISSLLAQDDPVATPPVPPFLKNVPSHAAWTITYTYSKDIADSKPPADITPTEARLNRRLIKVQVTKVDAKRREIASWSDGTTSETWIYDNWIFLTSQDFPDIRVLDRSHLNKIFAKNYPDYSKADFPDFDWLSRDNFVGVQTVQDRKCYTFRGGSDLLDKTLNSAYKTDLKEIEASIDSETGLPVEFNNGAARQTYSFKGPPPTSLELPSSFTTALERYQHALKQPYTHTMK
jgi:hypothetical protein